MQGQGMSGERRPVCEGRTHWRSGDKVAAGRRDDTPPGEWPGCVGFVCVVNSSNYTGEMERLQRLSSAGYLER